MRAWLVVVFLVLAGHSFVLSVDENNFVGKIKHVVVLMEENRSFDHMFGWYKGNAIPPKKEESSARG